MLEAYDWLKRFVASSPSQPAKSKMADEHEQEHECTGGNNDGLTAKQRKNKKKKLAAKKKKQDQRENEASSLCCDSNAGETQAQDTKTPQEMLDEQLSWCISQLEIGLTTQKPDKATAHHTQHILNTLKSPKTPLPKKRQIMFSVFGDYRKKIEEDKKANAQKKETQRPSRVCAVKKNQQKSVFIRVSHQGKDVSECSPKLHRQEQFPTTTSLSTSWKFEPSSSNDFRFNFAKPE